MADVPVRELRNDTAGVLRRVEAGEDITITVHGRAVAQLVKASPRQRWFTRDEVIDVITKHSADPGLRDDLDEIAGDTTDDLTQTW
ncbi:type II toxin-antitoxin system Phd/YefM family antitoxin [Microbacterium sp. NIBRBAC000506063]|uniref:type II toxin-antitoxin system Phd/YefM family antitoxin n=1 Tax=Microbacterium sp. NIBRBAC000506063 TaxID=2734618 RepID=UPI001BB4E62E|nr:type II toxin-antitoxin system prevent-host-death family antitoxin [Microbacterium sp. NIBRBAC000506063]QTV79690.1 type II toxin-antitoxin system Phd/YefM family antitoxin [Microbacterium sp. NIBRBAC000506063]